MLGTALAYMALAFFIARISLAAAIAAGVASLSGGAAVAGAGAFCWAITGPATSASDRARPAADNIREKFVIPVLLDYGITAVQSFEFPARPPAPRRRRAR